jgi:diguanylate cyclase (GGDEF)-like protein
MSGKSGYLSRIDYDDVPAWDLVVKGINARRWVVVAASTAASAALLVVDGLIESDAHVLLGFFIIVTAMTWAGRTIEAIVAAEVLLAIRTLLEINRHTPQPPSLVVLGLLSGAVLLSIGIVMTRAVRGLVIQMDEAARRDSLTGLLNTRAFQEVAERERARAERNGRPISIAFLDLDRFKQINDDHGHVVGDSVLTAVGEIITSSVRATDIVGRVGGDEFTLVLPDTDQFEASAVLQRIRHRFGTRTDIPLITATTGYVTFTTPPESVEKMIQTADDLMYRAKRRDDNGILLGKVVTGRESRAGSESMTIDVTGRRHDPAAQPATS